MQSHFQPKTDTIIIKNQEIHEKHDKKGKNFIVARAETQLEAIQLISFHA